MLSLGICVMFLTVSDPVHASRLRLNFTRSLCAM